MAKSPSPPDETPETQDQNPASAPPSSRLGKIKILVFVVLVIALECTAVYWYLPAATESALLAGVAEVKKEETKTEHAEEADKKLNEQVEVDLGEFSVTVYQPVSNTTLRMDFHLYGTIQASEEKDFKTRWEENLHRFRDQVIVTVRSSEITDLTDAGLGLVKRKIMDKTNRILGKPYLQSIIFSEFSFIEQ